MHGTLSGTRNAFVQELSTRTVQTPLCCYVYFAFLSRMQSFSDRRKEEDTEEQTELMDQGLKRMVDYTISQILKEIAEQEQQEQEEEERRTKRTKVHY